MSQHAEHGPSRVSTPSRRRPWAAKTLTEAGFAQGKKFARPGAHGVGTRGEAVSEAARLTHPGGRVRQAAPVQPHP